LKALKTTSRTKNKSQKIKKSKISRTIKKRRKITISK